MVSFVKVLMIVIGKFLEFDMSFLEMSVFLIFFILVLIIFVSKEYMSGINLVVKLIREKLFKR